jgi:REP element-mobilizing transposase RayT
MFDRSGTRVISRRGGRRARAGRKPVNGKTNGPAHRRRAPIAGRHPVMVTMRFHDSITKNLRAPRFFKRIRACLLAAKVGGGARLCHFSVQKNHIHLIVEPPSGARGSGVEKALANAMRGLAIRIARTLNDALGRRGSAFAHRYDCRELASPLAVKNALNYVIQNGRKHHSQLGEEKPLGWSDPCCSAAFVSAWSRRSRHLPPARAPAAGDPVAAPQTWLLATGWHQKHGGLDAFSTLKLF